MTTDRRPIVGGNWKMNTDLASAAELADDTPEYRPNPILRGLKRLELATS